jgi:hypothetical protein
MKIVSDGGLFGTRVVNDDGTDMKCITAIDLHIDCEKVFCQLEVLGHDLEIDIEEVDVEFPEIAKLRRRVRELEAELEKCKS